MGKEENFEKLRYLISRIDLSSTTAEDIEWLLKVTEEIVCKDKDPVFQIGNFRCWLVGKVLDNSFQANITILNPEQPFPSQEELEQIMVYYGVHGEARYIIKGDRKSDSKYIMLCVSNDGTNPVPQPKLLSPRQIRFLNLKAEGRTQVEIAEKEGCSTATVASDLHIIVRRAGRFGFRQIWPHDEGMPFSENEYYKALKTRGKRKRVESDIQSQKGA